MQTIILQQIGSNTLKNSGKDAAISKCDEAIGPVANLCYAAVEKSDKGLESAENL